MSFYDDVSKYKNNVAVIDENGIKLSYNDLEAISEEIKEIIRSRSLVFMFCKNSSGAVCGYTAFLKNKIVPLLLDSNIDKQMAKNLIELYKPNYYFIPEEMYHEYNNCKKIWNKYGYVLLKSEYDIDHHMYSKLALLLTTSGSTGSPKLVRQSYKNIQANAESIVEYLKLDESERPITTLPMNYTYGLSIINSHLLAGGTILLTNRTLMEKEFWNYFKEERATSFGGVPYTYEILKKLRFFRMDLPSLKTMTQAGGKLSPELHKEFAQYANDSGKHFVVMYGQTEATARISYLPYEKSLEKYGSIGKAIPNGQLTLIDIDGKEINDPDIAGELLYKGPNVTLGYAECLEDLEKEDERNGVLETGDIAKMDSDGYFYIIGRKKRFLKIFGNRVNLDETERMIKTSFPDYEFACAGMDDKLYVFANTDKESILLQVKHYLAEKTGLNPNAFRVKFIDQIPKNEAGKTLYIKLEKFYD